MKVNIYHSRSSGLVYTRGVCLIHSIPKSERPLISAFCGLAEDCLALSWCGS
jgi:hypothetical protein